MELKVEGQSDCGSFEMVDDGNKVGDGVGGVHVISLNTLPSIFPAVSHVILFRESETVTEWRILSKNEEDG